VGVDRNQFITGVGGPGLGQQVLDNHFRLLVCALAEVVMPDMPLRVGEIKRGPVVVSEGTPYRVVVIDRDGVTNPHLLDGPADVISVVLERELGRVDADHHQPAADVFPGPGADIGKLAYPVDASIRPEADQDDFSGQFVAAMRRRRSSKVSS
jgi:hypothetical protein